MKKFKIYYCVLKQVYRKDIKILNLFKLKREKMISVLQLQYISFLIFYLIWIVQNLKAELIFLMFTTLELLIFQVLMIKKENLMLKFYHK